MWSQYGFQDGISPIMEEFIMFHDMIMMLLVFIVSSVGVVMLSLFNNKFTNSNLLEGQMIEWIWTLIPGIILIFIAVPSISLMYMYDEMMNFDFTVKAVGSQWYWSYEYFAGDSFSMDSFMLTENFLSKEGFRLLDTDCPLILPYQNSVQILVSSKDVLHSWTVPSLGVKVDAVPGRINSLAVYSFLPGIYFGQCSEICGANHSFMPIMLEMIHTNDFIPWLMSNIR